MNQQYVSFVVVILAQLLPHVGVQIGSQDLTTFVSVGVSLIAGLWGIIAGWRSGVHTLGGTTIH